MLIGRQELRISTFMSGHRRRRSVRHLEVHGNSGGRIDAANGPLIRAALAYFRLGHVVRLYFIVLQGCARSNRSGNFEFPRRQHFERRSKAHDQVPGIGTGLVVGVPPEDPPQTFFEDRLREGITQDGDAARSIYT